MILGGKAKGKHRKGAPAPTQTTLSPSAVARMQEDARTQHYAASRPVREADQARFNANGLPRYLFEGGAR